MTVPDLCERIALATCHVVVGDGEKVVDAGSGVFIEGGKVLTAKHVILTPSGKPRGSGIALRGDNYFYEKGVEWGGVGLDLGMDKFMKPLNIDLVELTPHELPEGVVPLPLCADVEPVGTEVLIAGYPDDIGLPLDFPEHFQTMNPDMATVKAEYESRFKYFFRQRMIKKCMIGNAQRVTIEHTGGAESVHIHGASYWLDDHLTYGGSGGPVVNMSGELVAIISRKGMTSAAELDIRSIDQSGVKKVGLIPSGIGLALSHHLITETRKAVL